MNRELELSFSPDKHEALPPLAGSTTGEKNLLPAALREARFAPSPSLCCSIIKKSIDARNKQNIRIRYKLILSDETGTPQSAAPEITRHRHASAPRPVVIGSGPAGMFAALTLARHGCPPIVIERGRSVEQRILDVNGYINGGALLPFSNVQFGEGGAGTFSDGKLYSGVSDSRRSIVLDTFVNAGAPPEIRYLAHPHVGTDRLRTTVASLRTQIIALGGTFLFERTVNRLHMENGALRAIEHVDSATGANSIHLPAGKVVLATGHSARDTYALLKQSGVTLTQKPFSVGVRIEHPQSWINRSQYGPYAGHPALPPAEYKLVAHSSTGRSLYTFCMCPGGFVVAGASSDGQVVTNGMSNYRRDERNANSAILVNVDRNDFSDHDVLAGIRFQESLEHAAFIAGGGNGYAPCQRLEDFLADRESTSCGKVTPSFKPGVTYTNMRPLLPPVVANTICEGIAALGRKLSGFSHPDSLLTGFETRSSSPVRIPRDESLCSPDAAGLYPCGEGAGYAGGIMSSAIDGIKCAERIVAVYGEQEAWTDTDCRGDGTHFSFQ